MTLHPPLEVSSREVNDIHYVDVHGRLTIGDPSEQLSTFVQQLVAKGAPRGSYSHLRLGNRRASWLLNQRCTPQNQVVTAGGN